MRVGLIDVDGHHFPNLALMKLSAWHKANGDHVEMVFPLSRYDRVYASKVFTFSPDIDYVPMTDDFRPGGSGYDVTSRLPDDVEHIRPDYSLYGIHNTAYGFLTRGCPRGCPFCIVGGKEGMASRKVADLSEWWNGEDNIVLMDPNILASPDHIDLFGQLVESNAIVDINQGLDVRLLNDRNAAMIQALRVKRIHFAWDGKEDLSSKFQKAAEYFGKLIRAHRVSVYVLVNYGTSLDWDLHRVMTLAKFGFDPFVMVYDKQNSPLVVRKFARWCNMKSVFKSTAWSEYQA